MSTFRALWVLLRVPNLLIAILTQVLLYSLVIYPSLNSSSIPPNLQFKDLLLLGLATAAITAAGYIWNDIVDYPIDCVNKPKKVIIQKSVSLRTAYWLYACISLLGWIFTLYLAFTHNRLPLVILYPLAAAGLAWYSLRLKGKAFWGNFVVSVYCAGVPALVWIAEKDSLIQLQLRSPESHDFVMKTMLAYLTFAFLSTLFREIVKDLEDLKGDEQHKLRTLPLLIGIPATHMVLLLTGAILVICLLIWGIRIELKTGGWLILSMTMTGPMLYNLWQLCRPGSRQTYHQISSITKAVMVAGLLLLLITHYVYV